MSEIKQLNKKEVKLKKIANRDAPLYRDHSESLRKMLEDNKNSDEDEADSLYMDVRAKNWWLRFDRKHFRHIDRKDYIEFRDLMTSNRLIQCFSTEIRPIDSYAQQKLINHYDLMEEKRFVHLLFKSTTPYYSCLASYEIQQAIPNYSDGRREKEELTGIKISPSNSHLGTDSVLSNRIREIKLSLAGWNEDEQICRTAQVIKTNSKKNGDLPEMDREIELWERQLSKANGQNNVNWNQLIQSIRSDPGKNQKISFSSEVASIKEYLMGVTMLKYFQHGLEDKTAKMLQALIDSQNQSKPIKSKQPFCHKFFQTDCKICFCSFNHDSNQVLYCDKCNTSYHLACYGLSEIPKQEKYYCDCCFSQQLHATTQHTIRKLNCQICCKQSFPLKQIEGHFYHVTCLALLNYAEVKEGGLLLKMGVTHQKIQQQVVHSQIIQEDCFYCTGNGLKLACAQQGCNSSMHPICAYINGCKFVVKKDVLSHRLSVQCFCRYIITDSESMIHNEISRYMCNLNKTTSFSLAQFRSKYREEEEARKLEKQKKLLSTAASRIINKTRIINRYIQGQESKANQASKVVTQSSKFLEKLYRKFN